MNFSNAAKAYSKVGLETAVGSADPLGLVLMLYDGAILAVNKAMAGLRERNLQVKGESISKAIQIIEEGLRASLDRKAGGAIAAQLDSLYEYMCQRLLLSSVGNDPVAMSEIVRLLSDLRDAWATLSKRQPNAAGVSTMAASVPSMAAGVPSMVPGVSANTAGASSTAPGAPAMAATVPAKAAGISAYTAGATFQPQLSRRA